MEKALYIETPAFDVCEQMAADELLCSSPPAGFLLRFYEWADDGITYGYSQKIKEVRAAAALMNRSGLEYTRRPTGGGLVLHEKDLTFSFIFPSPELDFAPAAAYDRLHTAISGAYKEHGIKYDLLKEKTADYKVNGPLMTCFKKPVCMDMLEDGRKILGGALRKFGGRMLYQGSLQTDSARRDAEFNKKIITGALEKEYCVKFTAVRFTSSALKKTMRIAESKYRTLAWKERI